MFARMPVHGNGQCDRRMHLDELPSILMELEGVLLDIPSRGWKACSR